MPLFVAKNTQYKDQSCQVILYEKVSVEVAVVATYYGAYPAVTVKHVGMNVAADPLMTLGYTGRQRGRDYSR